MYLLDGNERHQLSADTEMRMMCVFNPPVTGREVHDDAPAITDRYPSRLEAEQPPIPRSEPVVWSATDEGPLAPPALTQMSEQGFLIRPSTVYDATVSALRNEIDRVPSQLGDDPRIIREAGSHEVRSIFEAHVLSSVVMDVACSPGVLDVAEQLLGGPVYLHQSRINAMPAFRGRGFYWHSDFETWHTEDGLPQMRTVSCSIALTVNVAYNGTLQVMPGTHRTFYPCVGATPRDNHRKSGIELFLGQPGDALWFDCNLMHGSGSNISPYPRSNVFLVFNSLHRAIAASAMGNATEWYDYGVYAATTTFLTQAFFPTLGTAFTMLGYAISFLLRPLGGMVWGPLGDKLGRKSVMAITIVLMALSTTLIGVLPSWATIGMAAPALLILLRVVQGFSTGGEYGGAATFM
ncbi:putative multi-domain containing protein, partial [Aduncisulcus paluster]